MTARIQVAATTLLAWETVHTCLNVGDDVDDDNHGDDDDDDDDDGDDDYGCDDNHPPCLGDSAHLPAMIMLPDNKATW